MYDASNRKDIRIAEKAAARLDLDRIEFLRAALSTIQGRTFFYDFLTACHCFDQPPTFDPNKDYFALGERNVGLRIFADITAHCPDQYLTMTREAYARDHTAAARQRPSSPNPDGRDQGRWEPEPADAEDGDAAGNNYDDRGQA